jgi:hypothetical protein
MSLPLTYAERERFEIWILEHVNTKVVPSDEGNENGLIYNLIHLLRGDGLEYIFTEEQDREVESLRQRIAKGRK